jgi:myosin heavy subunit
MNASHVIKILNEFAKILDESHQFPQIKKTFLSQLFYYINSHTLNAMLSPNSKYCTMGTSIMLKMAVSELESWGQQKGVSGNELAPLRQISDVLMMNKPMLADESIRKEVCPALTTRQIRKMLQCFKPDEYDPLSVPASVLKQFPSGGNENDYMVDTSIVFRPKLHIDGEMPMWRSVEAPVILRDHKDFAFLNEK